ncbi:MAG TPA: 2-phospho-L-lactate guanylyltransferase [Pseudomonadales bacterium]|nr:2-phospho-L-lactate guanylyltransferase [Pseudomonadales bacterium]
MWAIVPVKQFHLAKQRLAPGLSETERADLFRAMVADVLACIRATAGITHILVVTREPAARDLAAAVDAEILVETDGGLVPAVTQGAAAARLAGAAGIVIVPGDLPLAGPADLQRVLDAHAASVRNGGAAPGAVTLVADAQGIGTNCLACTPPDLIAFRFGTDSCSAHRDGARQAGVEATVLAVPGLALDVDTPADLAAFVARAGSGHAVAFLEGSGIASRIRASAPHGAPAAATATDTSITEGNDRPGSAPVGETAGTIASKTAGERA